MPTASLFPRSDIRRKISKPLTERICGIRMRRPSLPPPVNVAAGGHGARIVLEDGRELIDGTSSWWCAAFGYNRPEIVEAIQKQASKLTHVMFAGFTHQPAVELAKRLTRLLPEKLTKIFYADSGSVAVEVAMKLAVQYQLAKGRKTRTNFATIRQG